MYVHALVCINLLQDEGECFSLPLKEIKPDSRLNSGLITKKCKDNLA